MSKALDLTNQKFNHWTVIERAPSNARGESMWLCECDCEQHTRRIVKGYTLKKGSSKSCGCLQKQKASESNFVDILNQTFGHLKVIKYIGSDNSRKSLWECECDCEAHTHIITRGTDLRSGKTISCGCIKSIGEQKISKILSENNIVFEKEKIFDNCIYPETNGKPRFDFYVNNQYIIEYDGVQHFDKENPWYRDSKYDNFKTQWCLENNIPIIRINYLQLNNLKLEDLILKE